MAFLAIAFFYTPELPQNHIILLFVKIVRDEIMSDKVVALLGGDRREIQVLPALLAAGWQLRCFGLPAAFVPPEAQCCDSIAQAVNGADAVILPMPGVRNDGSLYAPFIDKVIVAAEDLNGLKPGTPVIVGVASDYLRNLAAEKELLVNEILENDCLAMQNAIPTAEGAIQLAMENTPVTIDGIKALVIGYGRVGSALAERLRALGARVSVINRGASRRAAAIKDGHTVLPWEDLNQAISSAEVVFNTVPAPVLGREELELFSRHALLIELAGSGGGIDLQAAADLGIHLITAPGLPGKVAPVTAGKVMAALYPRLLNELTA
jgi:dipicolinate synthase subunit A